MKIIYIPFLVCLFPLISSAQNKELTEKDSISIHPVKSIQLGFNSQFAFEKVFSGENNAPLEFILRKQLKSNQAIRIRTIIDLKRMSRVEFENKNSENLTVFGLGLGKEWQVRFSKQWYGFYGIEFESVIKLAHKTQEFITPNPPDSNTYLERNSEMSNSIKFSVLPFMGLAFKISERLFAMTEFRLITSYQRSNTSRDVAYKLIREVGAEFDFSNDFSPSTPLEPELTVREFAFEFRPYTGIFLNYRF
jgi:penicillin-binding protein-related factor A (putative recombinase)